MRNLKRSKMDNRMARLSKTLYRLMSSAILWEHTKNLNPFRITIWNLKVPKNLPQEKKPHVTELFIVDDKYFCMSCTFV